MSFMERVNQGESLASWLNWLTEPLVVCWSVIMGDLLPSWKGVYWTLPEAFRTGPPSCAVHCMNGWLLANTGYNNRTTAHASANRRLVFGKWGLIYITIDFMVIPHERQGVSNHRQIDRLPQQLIQPNVKGNNKGPHYWPFVRGIRRSPTDSLHKKASIVQAICEKIRHFGLKAWHFVRLCLWSLLMILDMGPRKFHHVGKMAAILLTPLPENSIFVISP